MKKLLIMLTLALMPMSLLAQDLTDVKCIMNPKMDVKAETGVEFNGGTVYFCCNKCAGKFKADPDQFAAMANYQMVATDQFVQKACPVSGHDVADGVAAEVGSVSVGLCCDKCVQKIDGAKDLAAKVAIAFGSEAFARGYEPAAPEIDLTGVMCLMMPEDEVSADAFVEYNGGKVFFCCSDCIEGYNKDPEKFAAQANKQLVQTGQFVQTACPISGRPVSADKSVKIGEMEIGFCCDGCKGKVANADDDAARTEMVFAAEAFAKGFAAKSDK